MLSIQKKITLIFSLILFLSFVFAPKKKLVFYIIGDSTVRNGNAPMTYFDSPDKNKQLGWGSLIAKYFDTTKIDIQNHAIGGRSSRTFITEGRWTKILTTLKKGDFVIMQFGHNDAGPLDDTSRARGTIKGIGEDSADIYNPIRKMREVVHTYGWYMRKYVREAKEKGATPIICSPIPRNDWKNGKVLRSTDSYALWAKQIAEQEGAYFINLNDLVALKYEAIGAEAVKAFFPADHTHTNTEGAAVNAAIVIDELKKIKGLKKLRKALL